MKTEEDVAYDYLGREYEVREYHCLSIEEFDKLIEEGTPVEIIDGVVRILKNVEESIDIYWKPVVGDLTGNPIAVLHYAIKLLSHLRDINQ